MKPKFLKAEYVNGSSFTNFCDGKPCVMGIDEAGRGPVLGPMVYACAITTTDKVESIKNKLGVDDSKMLANKRRVEIFNQMNNDKEVMQLITYFLQIISPRIISACMTQQVKCSLNEISHNCAISLIQRALDVGINVMKVYVDTVGPKVTYQQMLKRKFPNIEITVTEKADSIYAIVSAASIVAKVTRDKRVSSWAFSEKHVVVPTKGYGSGYPGDPCTKQFLIESSNRIFGFSSFVRFSWKTAKTVMNKQSAQSNWIDDDEGVIMLAKTERGSYKRHIFYKERNIASTNAL